jgi:hypothetical protein
VTSHRLWLALSFVGTLSLAGPAKVFATPTPTNVQAGPFSVAATIDVIRLAQAQPAPAASPPATGADSAVPATNGEPIGNVATLSGTATVIRNKNSLPLHLRDDIFLNDQVQTSSSSSLGITFNDSTTFTLSANAKMTIDSYIYEDGGKQNTGLFDIGKGTVAFVAAAVAKTGDMKITAPTSTLGIRGTTGLVEVPQGAPAGGAATGENIKLYPDPDGHVGRIEVSDHAGQQLGALTQGASGFTVRPGVGGARPTIQSLTISPQQAARDQGLVRQVHAAQTVGRQIVSEQRAARRANPPGANQPNRGNQPAQPQRQNQNRPGQQGAPNRQGQQQPNQPATPGEKANTKQSTQPATQPGPGERKSETKPAATPAAPQRQGATPQPPAAGQPAVRQGGAPAPRAQRPTGPQKPKPPPPKEKKKRPF